MLHGFNIQHRNALCPPLRIGEDAEEVPDWFHGSIHCIATAFGGPIFYGHAAEGFNEKPDHPGNVYWYQAKRANELFQALDGKQRKVALSLKSTTLPFCCDTCSTFHSVPLVVYHSRVAVPKLHGFLGMSVTRAIGCIFVSIQLVT